MVRSPPRESRPVLCSPAEPKTFLTLNEDGEYSTLPETYGVDFLWFAQGNTCGAQRKTCADLIASIRGDRIAREMAQMKELHRAVIVIEGEWRWGRDGAANLKGYDHRFLRSQYDGIVMSLQANGIWVLTSPSINGTISLLRQLEGFMTRESHTSLFVRPKSRGLWGTWRDKDWACHLYQSFPGVSIGTASALYDTVGLPLRWTVTEDDLLAVPGVGKKRAHALIGALDGATDHPVR